MGIGEVLRTALREEMKGGKKFPREINSVRNTKQLAGLEMNLETNPQGLEAASVTPGLSGGTIHGHAQS